MKVKSESEVTGSCPTLPDPMDCSIPGSSVHGIFQARVLELGARDGGAWWAAVYGVIQSQTRLKRLSSSSMLFQIHSVLFFSPSCFSLNSWYQPSHFSFSIPTSARNCSQMSAYIKTYPSYFLTKGKQGKISAICCYEIKPCEFFLFLASLELTTLPTFIQNNLPSNHQLPTHRTGSCFYNKTQPPPSI